MFTIKNQEIHDKNTGVQIATGAHDNGTQWLRVTVPGRPAEVKGGVDIPSKTTTVFFTADGSVTKMDAHAAVPPVSTAPPPDPLAKDFHEYAAATHSDPAGAKKALDETRRHQEAGAATASISDRDRVQQDKKEAALHHAAHDLYDTPAKPNAPVDDKKKGA